GIVVSIASGAAAASAAYVLSRDLCARRVAVAAGLLVAVHPRLVEAGAAVQSDGLHFALVVAAALAAWRALSSASGRASLGAGAICGLAYLTRPEGLLVGLVLAAWLAVDRARGARSWRSAARVAAGFALALTIVAGPYLVAMRVETGTWRLTSKKEVGHMLDVTGTGRILSPGLEETWRSRLRRLSRAWFEVLHDGLRAVHPLYLVLILTGISWRRPRRMEAYLLSFALALLPVLVGLQLSYGYVSRRHWLPAVVLALPLAAQGIGRLAYLSERASSGALHATRIFGLYAALLVGVQLANDVSLHDPDVKLARREAALWIGRHDPGSVVAAKRSRLAYYAAAARFVSLERHPQEAQWLARLRSASVRYAILPERLLESIPADERAGAAIVYRAPYGGGAQVVVQLRELEAAPLAP
ncbi:MAG: glycosyltransferase family 39 protein, partial [Myxococcota bacterium]